MQDKTTSEILEWVQTLDKTVVATSSFQTQSLPFLHMLSRSLPQVPILFLDTGFHFPETLAYKDQLVSQLGLNIQVIEAPKVALYQEDTDACCGLNKVQPLQQALASAQVWLTGIRRDQTSQRQAAQWMSVEPSGLIKICPMLDWTELQIQRYIDRHNLPQHPLTRRGYLSIGCAPCTEPAVLGASRSGRWAKKEKTECGIHGCPFPRAQ